MGQRRKNWVRGDIWAHEEARQEERKNENGKITSLEKAGLDFLLYAEVYEHQARLIFSENLVKSGNKGIKIMQDSKLNLIEPSIEPHLSLSLYRLHVPPVQGDHVQADLAEILWISTVIKQIDSGDVQTFGFAPRQTAALWFRTKSREISRLSVAYL